MMLSQTLPLTMWFKQSFTRLFSNHSNKHGEIRQRYAGSRKGSGQVYLIGAGPGDAELLTMKAHRLIQEADVVLYDWLVNPDVLALIPKHAESVFVGKKCGRHSVKQDTICQMLVDYATKGKVVVRLKGGDPAIFARAAEECVMLEQHGIDYAIVPGITAASGASAYAGIPLTHRDCAQSVRFITAHFKNPEHEPDWQSLAQAANSRMGETLVFYMGLGRVEQIAERLIEHGLSGDTPMAIIDQATEKTQQVVTTSLIRLSACSDKNKLKGPALIIVGDVVNKRYEVNSSLLQATIG